MTIRSAVAAILFISILCPAAHAAEGPPGRGEWRERSAGFLVSSPELRFSIDNAGNLSGEAVMKPGSGILLEPVRRMETPIDGIELAVRADGCNASSLDYKPGSARFPFAVTLIYGKDRQEAGWVDRIRRFFSRVREGLPASGIRLTYAWACRAPVGSMYRLTDEETVFVVAGIDEAGKRIESTRAVAADFKAAYGRPPAGPATGVAIRLDRPSKEKGELKVGFELKLTP